jgi:crossover junction endodeoxyribonuclease RuvC
MAENKTDRARIDCWTTYIGIDPGVHGSITYMNEAFVENFNFPTMTFTKTNGKKKTVLDLEEMSNMLQKLTPANSVVVIEDVHSMPNQGVASSFQFGRTVGQIEAMMTALTDGAPHYVTPQKWKKFYSELITDEMLEIKKEIKDAKGKDKTKLQYAYKKKAKAQAVVVANGLHQRLYPMDNGTEFFGPKEHDRAESYLICYYGYKNL